jgi:hypothetical protein
LLLLLAASWLALLFRLLLLLLLLPLGFCLQVPKVLFTQLDQQPASKHPPGACTGRRVQLLLPLLRHLQLLRHSRTGCPCCCSCHNGLCSCLCHWVFPSRDLWSRWLHSSSALS